MEHVSWKDKTPSMVVPQRVNETLNILDTILHWKYSLRWNVLWHDGLLKIY